LRLLQRPFPPTAWRFLTGDEASITALATAVGFGFKKDRTVHSSRCADDPLAGRKGYTVHVRITYLPADLEMAVREAASGLARPSISKALSFCFSYDPQGRRYVVNFTRIAGSISLLLAAAFGIFVLLSGRSRDRTERARS